uniref:Polyprotein n=1 Tax=Cucumber vein yellowing virus TaxID=137475 RepID=A0A6M3B4C6_9POTY|nr:polyprotein [Cucumber vein yellowing virus]
MAEVYSFVPKTDHEKRMVKRFGTDKFLQFREQCPLSQVRKCWTHFKVCDGACYAYLLVHFAEEEAQEFLELSAGRKKLVLDNVRRALCSALYYNPNEEDFECECGNSNTSWKRVCEDCEQVYTYSEMNLLQELSKVAGTLGCNINELKDFTIHDIADEVAFARKNKGVTTVTLEPKILEEVTPKVKVVEATNPEKPIELVTVKAVATEKSVKMIGNSKAVMKENKPQIGKVWKMVTEKPKPTVIPECKPEAPTKKEIQTCLDLVVKIGDFIINTRTREFEIVGDKGECEEKETETKPKESVAEGPVNDVHVLDNFFKNFQFNEERRSKIYTDKHGNVRYGKKPVKKQKKRRRAELESGKIITKIETPEECQPTYSFESLPSIKRAYSKKKPRRFIETRTKYPVRSLVKEIGKTCSFTEIMIIDRKVRKIKKRGSRYFVDVRHLDGCNPNVDLDHSEFSDKILDWLMASLAVKSIKLSAVVPGTSGLVTARKNEFGKFTIIRGWLNRVVDAREKLTKSQLRKVRNYTIHGVHAFKKRYQTNAIDRECATQIQIKDNVVYLKGEGALQNFINSSALGGLARNTSGATKPALACLRKATKYGIGFDMMMNHYVCHRCHVRCTDISLMNSMCSECGENMFESVGHEFPFVTLPINPFECDVHPAVAEVMKEAWWRDGVEDWPIEKRYCSNGKEIHVEKQGQRAWRSEFQLRETSSSRELNLSYAAADNGICLCEANFAWLDMFPCVTLNHIFGLDFDDDMDPEIRDIMTRDNAQRVFSTGRLVKYADICPGWSGVVITEDAVQPDEWNKFAWYNGICVVQGKNRESGIIENAIIMKTADEKDKIDFYSFDLSWAKSKTKFIEYFAEDETRIIKACCTPSSLWLFAKKSSLYKYVDYLLLQESSIVDLCVKLEFVGKHLSLLENVEDACIEFSHFMDEMIQSRNVQDQPELARIRALIRSQFDSVRESSRYEIIDRIIEKKTKLQADEIIMRELIRRQYAELFSWRERALMNFCSRRTRLSDLWAKREEVNLGSSSTISLIMSRPGLEIMTNWASTVCKTQYKRSVRAVDGVIRFVWHRIVILSKQALYKWWESCVFHVFCVLLTALVTYGLGQVVSFIKRVTEKEKKEALALEENLVEIQGKKEEAVIMKWCAMLTLAMSFINFDWALASVSALGKMKTIFSALGPNLIELQSGEEDAFKFTTFEVEVPGNGKSCDDQTFEDWMSHCIKYNLTTPEPTTSGPMLVLEKGRAKELAEKIRMHDACDLRVYGGVGTGKSTSLPSEIMKFGPVLICVPTRVLANALHDSYMALFGYDVSVAYRGRVRTGTQPITVMTYGYALNHFHYNPQNLNSFEYVIMDEIHTFPTELNPLFSLIRETNPRKKIIKTSATHVGHNVELSTNFKVNIETLSPMGVKKWVELQGTNVFGDATSSGEVILVFVATYHEVDEAAEGLRNKGFPVLKVDGRNFRKNTEVQKMVDDLPGNIKFIVATNIIENGVTLDVDTLVDFGERVSPVLDSDGRSIIMARRRISKAERQQRFGRVGRMKPGTIYKFGKEALPDSMKSVVGATESAMICFAYGIKPVVDDVDIGSIARVTKKQALTASLYDLNRIFTVHHVDKHGFIPRAVHELFKTFMLRTEAVAICESYLSSDSSSWKALHTYLRPSEEMAHVRNVKIPWYCSDMSNEFIIKLAECVSHAKPKFSCGYDVENVDFHVVAHKISVGEHNIEESKALVSEILNRVKQWRDNLVYKMSTPRNNSLMSLMVGWIPKKIERTRSQLEMRIQRLEMLLSQLDNVSVNHDYESLVRFFAENPHSAEYLESQGKSEYLERKVLKTNIREADWRVVAGVITMTACAAGFAYWYLRRRAAVDQVEIQGKVGYRRDKRVGRFVFDGPDEDIIENFGVEYSHDVVTKKMSKAQKLKQAKEKGWKIGKVDRPKKIFRQLYGVNPLEFDEVYLTVGDFKGEVWETKDMDIDEMYSDLYSDFDLGNRKGYSKDVYLVFSKKDSDIEAVVDLQPHRSKMASSMSLNPMGFPEEEGRWRQSGDVRMRKRIEEEVEVQVAETAIVSKFAHIFQRLGRLGFSGRGLNCVFHGDKSIMPYHLASGGDPSDSLIVTTSRGQFDMGPMEMIKCKKITDFDLVVGQLPKDMQPFKSTNIMRKPKMDEDVVIITLKRDKGKMLIRTSDTSKIYKADDKYAHLWVHFIKSESGDCGSPIVALSDSKIVGFHSGMIKDKLGVFLRSVFTPVNDELLRTLGEKSEMNDFWKFNQNAISWNAVIKTSSLFPVMKDILGVHLQVGAGDKYIGGNLMTVGEVNKHAYHNHVIKGKRKEFVEFCARNPNNNFEKFRDFYGPSVMTVSAFYKDLLKYDEPIKVGVIDFPSLVHAYLNVEDKLLSLGFDEDCGPEWDPYEIYCDLNKKAAMGALYQGSKNEWLKNITPKEFIEQVQESYRLLGHGVVGIWSGSLKAELRTKAKIAEGKTRVFTGAPIDVLLAGKVLVDKFNKHFYTQHLKGPWSVGINKFNRGWDKLARYFNHDWKFIDCDGSRFDSSLSPILFQMVCHMRERFGHFDWAETNALRNLYAQIVYTPILTIDGNIVKKHKGNNSGQPSTVVDNTLILMLVVEYCKSWHLKQSGIEMEFKYMCNGDDLIINAPDSEINIIQSTFKNLFKECGLNYDFDDLHDSIEDVEYMSHHFVLREGIYIPKLSKERLVAILEWERSDELFRTRSALNAAYIESFGYDDIHWEIERFAAYWANLKGVKNVLMDEEHVRRLYLDENFELTDEIIQTLSPASFEFGYVELQADEIDKDAIEQEIEKLREEWKANGPSRTVSNYEARKKQTPIAAKVDELLKQLKDAGVETLKRPCGQPNANEDKKENLSTNWTGDSESEDEEKKKKAPLRGGGKMLKRDDVDKIPTNAMEFKRDFKPARASRTSYIWIPRSQRDNLTPDVVKNFLAYIPPSQAIDNQMASGSQVENWAMRTASAYGVTIQQFYETVLPAWIVNCIVNGTSDERKTETVWRAVELNAQGEDVDDMEYPIEPIYKHALPTMRKIMRNFSSQAILMYQNSVAEGKAFTVKAARNAGYSEIEDQWLGIDFLAEAQLSRNQLNIKHQTLAANVSRNRRNLFALAAPGDDGRVNAERHLTTDASASRHTYGGAMLE